MIFQFVLEWNREIQLVNHRIFLGFVVSVQFGALSLNRSISAAFQRILNPKKLTIPSLPDFFKSAHRWAVSATINIGKINCSIWKDLCKFDPRIVYLFINTRFVIHRNVFRGTELIWHQLFERNVIIFSDATINLSVLIVVDTAHRWELSKKARGEDSASFSEFKIR